jgi:uncharacterized protein (DUF433 family)
MKGRFKLRIQITENDGTKHYVTLTEDEIDNCVAHFAHAMTADKHEYVERFGIERNGKWYALTDRQIKRCIQYANGEI